jgi:hypothetical protein
MRVSKGTLQRSLADLQAEVEKRIHEGFLARIRRYFLDRELQKRIVLARGVRKHLDRETLGEGF